MTKSNVPFAGDDKQFFALQQFGSLNTKAKRTAIADNEFSWLENMMPVGDGNLQAMYSNGSSIFTAPGGKTIIYMYFYNIGNVNYVAAFFDDGTATQINTSTMGTTVITATPGLLFPGSAALGNPAPAASQYGQSGIVIVATSSPDAYFAWDGVTGYAPGDASPAWLNGGTPTTMPTGVSGTAVETFLSRVWVTNAQNLTFGAPGNGASFSGVLGGGTTPSVDSFLRRERTQVRQANGFLYVFGDSSVNVVSNVNSSGSPILTTFNNQNVDPQAGTPWHNSVQAFGRGLVFGNSSGVYAIYGGAADKVSDQLDGIFEAAGTTLMSDSVIHQPSGAIMTINDVKCYMILLPIQDLFTGVFSRRLAIWDGKKWFLGSQTNSMTYIATQEINSILSAWGTDGHDIFPLFTTPSSLRKIWQSKLWAGDSGFQTIKQAMRLYTMAEDNSGSGYEFTGTIDAAGESTGLTTQNITIDSVNFIITWVNNSAQPIQFQNNALQNIFWTSIATGLTLNGIGGVNLTSRGGVMGWTLQSVSTDFTVLAHSLLYQKQSPLGA